MLLPGVVETPGEDRAEDRTCAIGGCSNHVCGEVEDMQDLITTCEFRNEYACYRDAVCERQTDGQCGWTETDALRSCLLEAGSTIPGVLEVQ